MSQNRTAPSALESFWQEADEGASNEHPLEREIAERVDALSRYRALIDDAQTQGRDDLADLLLAQHAREEQQLRRLQVALRRMRRQGD